MRIGADRWRTETRKTVGAATMPAGPGVWPGFNCTVGTYCPSENTLPTRKTAEPGENLLALLTRDLGADVSVLTALNFPAMLLRPASLEGFHKLRFHIHRQRDAAYNVCRRTYAAIVNILFADERLA